jgi:hypothetical protein
MTTLNWFRNFTWFFAKKSAATDYQFNRIANLLRVKAIVVQPHDSGGIAISQSLELRFDYDEAPQESYTMIIVSVEAVDRDLRKDPDFYVGSGGKGEMPNKIKEFLDYLITGKPIQPPIASVSPSTAMLTFGNGRHRFAVLRDLGLAVIPLLVPHEEAEAIHAKYGICAQSAH